MKLPVVALSLTFAPLLMVTAAHAATVTQLKGAEAEAHFKTVNGCITTLVDIFSATSATRVSGGGSVGSGGYTIAEILQFDDPQNGVVNGVTCGQSLTPLIDDSLELAAANVRIDDGRGTASVSGVATTVDVETGEQRTYTISLSWRPNGAPVVFLVNDVDDGNNVSVRTVGTVRRRAAFASGSILFNGVNLIPVETTDALVTSINNATVEVIRK